MAVTYRDYYAVLGVPRDANPEQIKTAFRKLAREYHPDVAKDKPAAEAKFKEINEAYEVLSDADKRLTYDMLGAGWENGATGSQNGNWSAEGRPDAFHFGGTGFSDFFEQYFGQGRRPTDFQEIFRQGRPGRTGMAEEPNFRERGLDMEGDILVTLEEVLHGSVREVTLRRTNPDTGDEATESFKVRIPPGAQRGRRIRVPGKGDPGQGGAPAGDLFLRVRLAGHPDYEVQGADLYHDLAVAPWEAVLGTQITVPTLDGAIKLRLPAGTNTGREMRIRGRGLPKGRPGERGDLYVVIRVHTPESMTANERALWEQLAAISRFNPRR